MALFFVLLGMFCFTLQNYRDIPVLFMMPVKRLRDYNQFCSFSLFLSLLFEIFPQEKTVLQGFHILVKAGGSAIQVFYGAL